MAQMAVAREGTRTWQRMQAVGIVLAVALLLTLINTLKPVALDDSIYYQFVHHIADHPADPYGFRYLGAEANHILAPPVVLYWWALGLRLFGQNPVAWKLWLLPFCVLLVAAVYLLGRRWARGMEWFLVGLVCLSPVLLPCLNLMLDVPALALSLGAVCLFLRAWDKNSLALALLAGLVSGVALETKYTAFLAPPVMLLYAMLFGKRRLALAAVSVAGLLFLGWELFTAARYGQSHFWLALTGHPMPLRDKLKLFSPLLANLGSTAVALLLAGLITCRRRVRWVLAAALLLSLGVVAILVMPENPLAGLEVDGLPVSLAVSSILFGTFGLGVCATVAVVGWRLVRQPRRLDGTAARHWLRSVDGFLVLWLLLEVVGYFALSPHPAIRRIMSLTVVAALLCCRLGARTCRDQRLALWGTCAFNLLLSLLLFAVDAGNYEGQKSLAKRVARECRGLQPDATIWYYGMGTFTYYGEQLGMRPLGNPEARVSPGDWVIVLHFFESRFADTPAAPRCVLKGMREWTPAVPLRSHIQSGGAAVTHLEEPVLQVSLFQVQ